MTPGRTLREAHNAGEPLVTLLAHDAFSARLIEAAGFPAYNIGGSSLLASRFALPDLGVAALAEMVDAMREVVKTVRIPGLVDGDDGYGDAANVRRTVNELEALGVGGILLEDQDRLTKQPGANVAKTVVPVDAMTRKLEIALDARCDEDLVIIARTDALGAKGMGEALLRAELFLQRGADGVFVAGARTSEQYEEVGAAFRGRWNIATVFETDVETAPTPRDLHGMGFSQVVYPMAVIQRVAKVIEDTARRVLALASGERKQLAERDDERSPAGFETAVAMAQWREWAKGGRPSPRPT